MNVENYTTDFTTDIKFLKGVGPRRGRILNLNNIYTVEDIIRYYPRKYLDSLLESVDKIFSAFFLSIKTGEILFIFNN